MRNKVEEGLQQGKEEKHEIVHDFFFWKKDFCGARCISRFWKAGLQVCKLFVVKEFSSFSGPYLVKIILIFFGN